MSGGVDIAQFRDWGFLKIEIVEWWDFYGAKDVLVLRDLCNKLQILKSKIPKFILITGFIIIGGPCHMVVKETIRLKTGNVTLN